MSTKGAVGGFAAAGVAYWIGVLLLPVVIAGILGVVAAIALAAIFPIALICAFFLGNDDEAIAFLITAPVCVGAYMALTYIGQHLIPPADWLSSVVAIAAIVIAFLTLLTLFLWIQLFIEGEGPGHINAQIKPTAGYSIFCAAYWGLTVGIYYADTGKGFWG